MSAFPDPSRQADLVAGPSAGQCTVIAVTVAASSIDLTTCGPQKDPTNTRPETYKGGPGHYVSIQADGADLYIVFGPDQGSVTGGHAPSATATGTNADGCCMKIPNGATYDCRPFPTSQNWLGFIGSGNGYMRVWRSSQ